jgi:hypothetical protein
MRRLGLQDELLGQCGKHAQATARRVIDPDVQQAVEAAGAKQRL